MKYLVEAVLFVSLLIFLTTGSAFSESEYDDYSLVSKKQIAKMKADAAEIVKENLGLRLELKKVQLLHDEIAKLNDEKKQLKELIESLVYESPRAWTSVSGKSMSAYLLQDDGTQVTLRDLNGRQIQIGISALCDADQEFLSRVRQPLGSDFQFVGDDIGNTTNNEDDDEIPDVMKNLQRTVTETNEVLTL